MTLNPLQAQKALASAAQNCASFIQNDSVQSGLLCVSGAAIIDVKASQKPMSRDQALTACQNMGDPSLSAADKSYLAAGCNFFVDSYYPVSKP